MGIKHMTNAIYRAETGKIFWCIIANLVIGVVGGIAAAVAVLGGAAEIASGGEIGGGALGGAAALLIIIALASVAISVITLMAYARLQKDFGETTVDGSAFGKLKIAAIIAIIGSVVGLIPVAGTIIALVCSIATFILYLIAFSALKNSTTFPGAAGAGTVFTAYILSLIGAVLSIIPIINIVGAILTLIGLIMLIVGWAKIKNAPLPEEA